MPDDYDYVGQPLTTRMAKQLIENDFPPRHITVDDLRKEVEKLHIGRGGLPYTRKSPHPVNRALTKLNKEKKVKKISLGLWQIGSPSSNPDNEINENESDVLPRTRGSGEREVYIYYYPTYQQAAELKGESNFACKIGKTKDDSIRRIYSQTGTGMPEEPTTGLIIKTDFPEELERCIHSILKAMGRHKVDAPGTEWFNTNPDEVGRIFNSLEEFQSAIV